MGNDHYAILVAITRYPGLSNLGGPENDAEDFRTWLLDKSGGNLDVKNVKVIYSSAFQPVTDPENPDDANPTEAEFKRVLNGWLKYRNEEGRLDWRGRVGGRLYLFFAGHGFTAGALTNPALFTAQAQLGDTAHIAALRYASKIGNAGFFDEIVLVMDCCQDVLKASGVGDPTWGPPDRQASTILMEAYGAPRGRKSFESPSKPPPVRGYFSTVFMEALRNARADADGYVTALAVEDAAVNIWEERGYAKKTGVNRLAITPPPRMRLYRRVPPQVPPVPPGPDSAHLTQPPGPIGGRPSGLAEGDRTAQLGGAFDSSQAAEVSISATIVAGDHGASIRVLDTQGHAVASGIGSLPVALSVGEYAARFRVGDTIQDRRFEVNAEDSQLLIKQESNNAIEFSSPIPLEHTSTHHEYHYYPAMDLGSLAAQRANLTRFPDSVGTLIVFARDSAHVFGSEWQMPPTIRQGLRLRKLNEKTSEPHAGTTTPTIDPERGYSSLLLNDLTPGTYLLGVRRLQRDHWSWEEMVLTVASSWWRTEVYLDSIDDDWTGRRFDIESASVLIVPGKGGGSLYGSGARFTEVARLALLEGRIGVDEHLLHWVRDMGLPEPMLALYTAYALSLSPHPDRTSIKEICRNLRNSWSTRSADVKLLECWCSRQLGELSGSIELDLKPDEVPMIARGWDLSTQLGDAARLAISAQEQIGMWRTSGSLWTHTQVPEQMPVPDIVPEHLTLPPLAFHDSIDLADVASTLKAPSPSLSPLEQALRRALMDSIDSGQSSPVRAFMESFSNTSGLDPRVVLYTLNKLRSSTWSPATDQEDSVGVQYGRPELIDDEFHSDREVVLPETYDSIEAELLDDERAVTDPDVIEDEL